MPRSRRGSLTIYNHAMLKALARQWWKILVGFIVFVFGWHLAVCYLVLNVGQGSVNPFTNTVTYRSSSPEGSFIAYPWGGQDGYGKALHAKGLNDDARKWLGLYAILIPIDIAVD